MTQRPIKFRAWDANRKLMMLTGIIVQDGRAFLNDRDFEDAIQSGNYLMQFTGLHDKNGKEIYEGDVLAFGVKSNAAVEYIDGGFKIEGIYLGAGIGSGLPIGDVEVIGNIYEHPNLLK